MNSALRSGARRMRRARKRNAGAKPALESEGNLGWLTAAETRVFGEGATPQDPDVSFAIRRMSLTMERELELSEFNAVIEVRCLINESSNST